MLLDVIIAYRKGFFQPNVVCLALFHFKIEIEAFHSKLENFFDVSFIVFVALNVLFSASLWQGHVFFLFFFSCGELLDKHGKSARSQGGRESG